MMNLRTIACGAVIACSREQPTEAPIAASAPTPPPSIALSATTTTSASVAPLPHDPPTLEALARAITTSRDVGEASARLRPLASSMGATYGVESAGFTVAFAAPLDAGDVARAFAVTRPYAVSGDVHQHSWRLVEGGASVPDAHQKRIATTLPNAGVWSLDITLEERPSGALPIVVSGASPAYDLLRTPARVIAIRASL